MYKTIYTSETKQDRLNLELSWSADGIHMDISQEDNTYLASLLFTTNDIKNIIEELELYVDAVADYNKVVNETTFPSETIVKN